MPVQIYTFFILLWERSMEEKLTLLEAYKAMLSFLDEYYFHYELDNLGGILGSLELMPNNTTADPAAWEDWLEAVKRVLAEKQG
jgi:hypothetical protein